jgi:hypothetical protein
MVPSLECPEIDRWQVLLDSDPPPDQLERFEQHLEQCPACRVRLDLGSEHEEQLRRWARRVGDPTAGPADPTLSRFLQRMSEGKALLSGVPADPADLYFLCPDDRPNLLGTLGDYEVREVIGQGGMGVVLKAYEPALHRLVAIKVLATALAGSATARRRFTREAKAAAAVCHEHIVAVHGVQEIAGLPYLVMQYIAGESLQDRLDRVGALEVEEIVRIGLQTASGLAAAHAQGLIHRDIKPANLLLENGLAKVKITDFGLARMVDDVQLTQMGVVAGTPEYMAPEQARGEVVDHRADLFSLGSVLYACCTGRPPFSGETLLAILHAVNERAPLPIRSLNPDMPAWLEALVAGLMAKNPADRYQNANDVATLLEGYLAHLRQPALVPAPGLPPVSCAESAGRRPVPVRRAFPFPLAASRFRVAMLLLVGIALLGCVGALLLTAPGNRNPPIARNANPNQVQAEPCDVWSVAVSPDGKVLAAGAGWWTTRGEVGVWDLGTHQPLRRFGEDLGVGSVNFSPNSKLLAFSGWFGAVRIREWATGKALADWEMASLTHVAFSPDGSLLATANEAESLELWNVADCTQQASLQGDLLRFHRVTFSPDGKRLLACGGDWKPGGIAHLGIWDVASRKQILKLTGHHNTVFCVACSPDGKTIATGSVDQTIRLWDAETGHLRKTLRQTGSVDYLVFTSDSKTLLNCGSGPIIYRWDLDNGQEVDQFDTGISHVRALGLTPDGKTLVVGGSRKTLKIFDIEKRREVAVLWSGADPQPAAMDALPSTPAETVEPRSYRSIKLLVLALAVALVGAVGALFWFRVRRTRTAQSPEQVQGEEPAGEQTPGEEQKSDEEQNSEEEQESARAKISFGCSACGAKLVARGALVGKRVRCSQCSRAVIVPSIRAGRTD